MTRAKAWHSWSRAQFACFGIGMLVLAFALEYGTASWLPDFAVVGHVLALATLGVSTYIGISWAKRFDTKRFDSRDRP